MGLITSFLSARKQWLVNHGRVSIGHCSRGCDHVHLLEFVWQEIRIKRSKTSRGDHSGTYKSK